MSTAPNPIKRITITLSDAPPVRVRADEWPIVARADDHDGAVECQANHVWWILVRRHVDGRTIVYGDLDSGPGGVHAGWRGASAGYLLRDADPEATIRAIRRVAGVVGEDLGDRVIADLPPVDL